MVLPIKQELLQKEIEVPHLLAKLTYSDQEEAVRYMRMWGENRIAISEIYEELSMKLRKQEA